MSTAVQNNKYSQYFQQKKYNTDEMNSTSCSQSNHSSNTSLFEQDLNMYTKRIQRKNENLNKNNSNNQLSQYNNQYINTTTSISFNSEKNINLNEEKDLPDQQQQQFFSTQIFNMYSQLNKNQAQNTNDTKNISCNNNLSQYFENQEHEQELYDMEIVTGDDMFIY
ncbi:hypothetical protein PPERSA_09621 [Pseudocohnilembus persalinus]|uniref:Uncharacterized protein n=1 Tax=Pseudocohnilembus persalinus TaxID=266149 RepID=A0A0V0QFR6_PSEPJ|nr:hypothetical protein PPERSA_09621 [Pseudocohnilembus persalinus]|eukprot:KRX01015.1 hypothetical protein PPERSA_09621 [Pseudocohnilembus persalinus]